MVQSARTEKNAQVYTAVHSGRAMRFPRVSPLITHAACFAAGAIALSQWISRGGDVPFVGTSRSVPAAIATDGKVSGATAAEIPHPDSVDTWDVLFADGKAPAPLTSEQEEVDRFIVKMMSNLGNDLARGTPKLVRYLLDRENEKVCLKCGEVNPATAKKGYPAESCHYCGCALKHKPTEGETPEAYAGRLRQSIDLIEDAQKRREDIKKGQAPE